MKIVTTIFFGIKKLEFNEPAEKMMNFWNLLLMHKWMQKFDKQQAANQYVQWQINSSIYNSIRQKDGQTDKLKKTDFFKKDINFILFFRINRKK